MNKKTTTIPEKVRVDYHRPLLIETFIHRNSQINLSAIRTPEDIYTKHILDSLELTKILDIEQYRQSRPPFVRGVPTKEAGGFNNHAGKETPGDLGNFTLLDLGTGGGFPLLPLAITYPDIQCIGLDARKKKCFAIDEMVKVLGLKNVRTLWTRAEEATLQVDILTSRAVTFADQLFRWALPLVKPGGLLVLYKLFTTDEDNAILTLTRQHNLTLKKMHHYTLPGDEVERVIYVLQK